MSGTQAYKRATCGPFYDFLHNIVRGASPETEAANGLRSKHPFRLTACLTLGEFYCPENLERLILGVLSLRENLTRSPLLTSDTVHRNCLYFV